MGNVKPSKKQRQKLKAAAHKSKVTNEKQVQNDGHAILDDDQSVQIVKPSIQVKTNKQKSKIVRATGKNATSPEMIQSVQYYLDQWKKKSTVEKDSTAWKFKVGNPQVLHRLVESFCLRK